ncbi:MAG TPA: hypothetical protein VFS43_18235 [Polyangiaceae bacterium]|nr:hypothetical protein [Polyangiaceae bacterium]
MKPAGDVAAFREALAELVPDLALSLGAWAERLHALVGPLRAARAEPVGDPDGFDGVARRGSYERLTHAEWLLADEAPDEFLRRAASGEHAFWRLAHRGPIGSRRCVALAAGGSELLGAPRLVALAALLALARRAAEARADFSWAFWGAGGPTLYERLEADGVRHWLREGRALVGPGPAEIARFFDERVRPAASDDAWLIGGAPPALGPRPAAYASVAVGQVPDLEGRRARVRLERPGAPPRSLELDLPEPARSARWLRSPFLPPPAPLRKEPAATRAALDAPPAFSHDGRRLFVRLEGGEIVAHVVPNSAAAPPAPSITLRPQRGGVLLGAGALGKALWAVELAGRTFWLYRFGKRGGVAWERNYPLAEGAEEPAPDPLALAPLLLREGKPFEGPTRTHQPLAFLFLPPRLLAFESDGSLGPIYEGDAIGLGQGPRGQGAVVYWVGESGELRLSTWGPVPCDGQRLHSRLAPNALAVAPDEAFFGEWGSQCALALRAPDGAFRLARWDLRAQERFEIVDLIAPPPGARAVGLAHWPAPGELSLVVLGPDRRAFQYVGASVRGPLAEAPGPVRAAAYSPASRALAYRTEAGLLVVRALGPEQDVLRLEPAAGAPS